MILTKIINDTKKRVEALYQLKSKDQWIQETKTNSNANFNFYNTIKTNSFSIIAEVKKASPSKGVIDAEFDYRQIARDYKDADVDCISVLTEPYHFLGDNQYLKDVKDISQKPVLRKDFIIDEIQIYESIILGADCILLIASILTEQELKHFIKLATTFRLSVLVETHNAHEIDKACKAGATLIGVNNRDLTTFTVDINHSISLRNLVPKDILFVSESGIKTKTDIKRLKEHNVDAVLIGETFMKSTNKKQIIKEFKDEEN